MPLVCPKPYWQTADKQTVRLYHGDVLDVLKRLPSGLVQCVVTSPPYWGLRDYGTAQWVGGSSLCDHAFPIDSGVSGNKSNGQGTHPGRFRDCPQRCGARRIDQQLGSEVTPEEYVARMVEVFREVRRVLRDDGACWLNLGCTYASTVSNPLDTLNSLMKGCSVIFFDSLPEATSAKGIKVPTNNQGPPQIVLKPLLCSQRESVKQRNNHLSEVCDFFAAPSNRSTRLAAGFMGTSVSNSAELLVDGLNYGSIILTNLDTNLQSKLLVLRPIGTGTSHDNNTSFPVKKSSEPRTEISIGWHTLWESFLSTASLKSGVDVNVMNQTIPFLNRFASFACLGRDFIIVKASQEQVTFQSIDRLLQLIVSDVSHLRFSLADGCIISYKLLYEKSIQITNRNRQGQEIDIPNLVKTALQEDGWICRQTIIWSKPSPMPESVRNRCTKSHEYLFLLVKKMGYFYDAEAIREVGEGYGRSTGPSGFRAERYINNNAYDNKALVETSRREHSYKGGRNKRSVWTVASSGYAGAHFATFPRKLIEPMILAGTSAHGACVKCGSPWRRVVERDSVTPIDYEGKHLATDPQASGRRMLANLRARREAGGDHANPFSSPRTTGWEPSCECLGKFVSREEIQLIPRRADNGDDPEGHDHSIHANRNGKDSTTLDRYVSTKEQEEKVKVRRYVSEIPLDEHPVRPCLVFDPFIGSGTTAAVSVEHGRSCWGIDLSEQYLRENAVPRVKGVLLARPTLAHLAGDDSEPVELGKPLARFYEE